MFSMLGTDIVDGIVSFLNNILLELNLDYLLYIFGGLSLLLILISGVRLIWCYEDRTMRAIKRVNKYLKNNPKINDDNLVEFHKKMKKLPRRIRDRWQLFMLEREGSPSRYMTVEYCVKRPLYNSAILMNQKQIGYATVILAILGFIFSLSCLVVAEAAGNLANILLLSFIVPSIVLVLGSIYIMILHLRYNRVNHDFYDMFTTFVRNIDKATNTMPDYVDYELLFTKKEIEKGIPVLREYLEKRAMEEQRLLEKAKREDVNHSPYDFSSLGVNGAQLIERAVNESEKFLINKINMQNEITELEKQLQKTDANMEEIERDANRKLQAIKENLERLDKAMSETTNRVEINYNRRQSDAEMNKKLLLEKDLQTMLDKEKVAADALKVEIQKRKEIIEENKKEVEDALKSEYDTFATKVYDELNEKITRDNSESLHEMEMTVARLKAKVKEFTRDIEKKDSIIEARNLEIDNIRQQISRQRGKSKSKKDFGQDYIKVQENNPEGNINGLQIDMNDATPPVQNETYAQNYNEYAPVDNNVQYTETSGDFSGYNQEYNAEPAPNYDNFDPNYQGDATQSYDQNYEQTTENYENFEQQPYEQYEQQDNQYYDNNNYSEPMAEQSVVDGQYVDNNAFAEQNILNDNSAFDNQNYDYNQPFDNNQYYDTNEPVSDYQEQNIAQETEIVQPETLADNELNENNSVVIDNVVEPVQEQQNVQDENVVENNNDNVIDIISNDNENVIDLETPLETNENNDAVINLEVENPQTENKEQGIIEQELTKNNTEIKDETIVKKEEKELKPAKKPKVKKLTDEIPEDKKDNVVEEAKADDKVLEQEEPQKQEKEEKEEIVKKEEKEIKKYADNDDLVALQKQIEEENARLKKQQEELRAQIDKTLATMEKASNATKAERTKNIKKIKDLISKLKVEAENAKARGASKAELNKINKSAAELLKVISEYQSKK